MNRWLALAKDPDETVNPLPDTLTEPDKRGFCQVLSVCRVEEFPVENTARPSAPMPSQSDEPFRHGASVTGMPRTWTGRVVSLDEWRGLSKWDRHGPDGRMFCGACREWVMPGDCPHCEGGAA